MIVDIAWWDLSGSTQTIESLKARLDESTRPLVKRSRPAREALDSRRG